MERRDFLRTCLLACASGAVASIAFSGCKSVYYASYTIQNKHARFNKSQFKDENGKQRPFVVLRNVGEEFPIVVYALIEGEKTSYIALSTKCTHSGCEVQPNKVSLVCPCHGSEFSNKGKVLNPPAENDLQQYQVTEDNENIIVQL